MTNVRREGFSLMEVILAMSVLLGGVIVLGQLAAVGSRHARHAEDLATAQLLCETRLNEILSGAVPPDAVEEEPITPDSPWVVTQEVTPLEVPGVVELKVTVNQATDITADALASPPPSTSDVAVTLVRWIADPTTAPAADAAPADAFNTPAAVEAAAP